MKRASSTSPMLGITTVIKLPMQNREIKMRSKLRFGRADPTIAKAGAPSTTPSAYAEMAYPADAGVTLIELANCGNMPMIANSPVPTTKVQAISVIMAAPTP
ncbi:hypothetical protein GWA01_01610 [Gluconobacter wancherniae NBRC 103581]|uniref:Uncharacterized protein n=1 Tax=Gluconobacter wancherniae NBRC 103581 TaxID=656744 RepID=A0A511AZ11_9PROT|nr:hypothetical protein AA103581_1293 [Gluconobacter wancherniae NBRC 103581]GEK92391.1 hypothetical protein GWA01_01610 [Gluconobacter wancherniae NBRC 103581]